MKVGWLARRGRLAGVGHLPWEKGCNQGNHALDQIKIL